MIHESRLRRHALRIGPAVLFSFAALFHHLFAVLLLLLPFASRHEPSLETSLNVVPSFTEELQHAYLDMVSALEERGKWSINETAKIEWLNRKP